MNTKFKKISQFIEKLEVSNVISEEEQTLLLVGGEGHGSMQTNHGCYDMTNKFCDNTGCTNYSCNNGICVNDYCLGDK